MDTNYREVGELATFESITGVWEELQNSSGNSSDLSYVVIRNDGTYMEATYNGDALQNGQVGCYSIWESTIEQGSLGSGVFYIGENGFEVFTYENTMGYYEYELPTYNLLGGINDFDSEYERLTTTEAEFNFTPICQG